MEPLGSIYQRILKNRPQRIGLDPKDSVNVAEMCPICQGTGWVSRAVPLEDPRHGMASPCQCQREALTQALLRTAKMPTQHGIHTLGSFKQVEGCQDALRNIEAMADGNFNWNILTLAGNPGLGKTHLLEILGRAVVDKGICVRYLYAPDWLDSLRAGSAIDAEPSFNDLWIGLTNSELVLLDDINEHRVTPFALEQVGRLVDERYRNGGLLVVATNLNFIQMANVWDKRIADRLFEGDSNVVRVSKLTGPSYRTGEDWETKQ